MRVNVINPNPTPDNQRAFVRGWIDGMAVEQGTREPYREPDQTSWQATGYRFGRRFGSDYEVESAWKWCRSEVKKGPYIDVQKYPSS